MKSLVLSLFWLALMCQAQIICWNTDFSADPGFVSVDTARFRWSNGAYKLNSVVGDSIYAWYDLRNEGLYLDQSPVFEFQAIIHLERLSLYSTLFFGISDGSFAASYNNMINTGVMVGIGETYDGPFMGLYASNGVGGLIYNFSDTVKPGLTQEGGTYLVSCATSDMGAAWAELYTWPGHVMAARITIPYYLPDFRYAGLNYFTATMKGYVDEFGLGAELLCDLDSLSICWNDGSATVSETASLDARNLVSISPNPFNGLSRVCVAGPGRGLLAELFNISGERVAFLPSSSFQPSAGGYTAFLDGRNLHSGAYLCRVRANGRIHTLKTFVIR